MLERMWRKGNSPLLLVGMSAGTATVENSMEVPQKTKNRTTILFSSPTPRHISNKTIIQKDICTIPMFTAALFTIAKTWKQTSSDRWMDKDLVVHIYTMERYSAMKRKEIMSFAATWVQLKIIISKWSKSERKRQVPYNLYVESKIWQKLTYL